MAKTGLATTIGIAAALAACAAFGWARWQGARLYYNGSVVSTGLMNHSGVTYVPLKDVAAALHLAVQPKADGFALVQPGGAGQVEGVNGKVGDDLFNGEVRLKVLKVVRGDTYKRELSHGDDIVAPSGQDVVVVVMRMKNGTRKSQFPNVTGKDPTALTDENEHAYSPNSFPDGEGRNINLLPGAAADFGLVFTVPKTAVLKDLVYTVDCGGLKPTSFRISVKEPATSP